jgi:hypothetical protein
MRGRLRVAMLTTVITALVLAALVDATIRGPRDGGAGGGYGSDDLVGHGWPVVFAVHTLMAARPWQTVRLISPYVAVCDIALALLLCLSTGVVVFRFAFRLGGRLQWSIADILSLTVGAAAACGLVRFEQACDFRLSLLWPYGPTRLYPWFDQAAIYVAIGCTLALVLSTGMARLSPQPPAAASSSMEHDGGMAASAE